MIIANAKIEPLTEVSHCWDGDVLTIKFNDTDIVITIEELERNRERLMSLCNTLDGVALISDKEFTDGE